MKPMEPLYFIKNYRKQITTNYRGESGYSDFIIIFDTHNKDVASTTLNKYTITSKLESILSRLSASGVELEYYNYDESKLGIFVTCSHERITDEYKHMT